MFVNSRMCCEVAVVCEIVDVCKFANVCQITDVSDLLNVCKGSNASLLWNSALITIFSILSDAS